MENADINSVIVNDLSFSYPGGKRKIFNNINMHVPAGQFVCLLGQSGCGKSTLLRLLAGLEKPTTGEIVIGGIPHEEPNLRKAVVFQDYGLFPWMTAGENINIALKQRYPEKSKIEIIKESKEILGRVGLKEEVYDMLPKELSGGMQQRCAIARAFSIDSPILLMDEPFGALDAVTRAILQDLVLELWSQATPHKTVFFVTHDVDEALLLAEKVFILGQVGSDIIYESEISEEQRVNRSGLENPEAVKLRNEFVHQINKEIIQQVLERSDKEENNIVDKFKSANHKKRIN